MTDQIAIDELILSGDSRRAEDAIKRAYSAYGDHPVLRHDEVRVWRILDLNRSYELALELVAMFPDYFPGIKCALAGAIALSTRKIEVSPDQLPGLIAIAERAQIIDPMDTQVITAGNILKILACPSSRSIASAFLHVAERD